MSRILAGEYRENGGRGATGRISVFGILERRGKVYEGVVKNVSDETLVSTAITKVNRGSLISTDKFRRHNGHISYGSRHL